MAINQYGIKERKVKKKSYAKSNTAKKKDFKMVPDDRPGRTPKKKVYTGSKGFSKAREDARKNTAKPRPFGEAFKSARAAGKDKFLWKGKSYHTKTKSELEAGKSEKAKFETKARANKMPGRQSVFSKFKSSKTGAEFVRKLKQK